MNDFRRTTQELAPSRQLQTLPGPYNLHPSHRLPQGRVDAGFDALAARLPASGPVALDGYAGIPWSDFRQRLDESLRRRGLRPTWFDVASALKPESEIERLIAPFLGGDDPIFGRCYAGRLDDFFEPDRLARLRHEARAVTSSALAIVYGCGAALAWSDAYVAYVDLPKNELQFRARAGVPVNLGRTTALPPKPAYKRSYFVDWPVLNAHKKSLAGRVDLVVDSQGPDEPMVVTGDNLRAGLAGLATSSFRVRPWFEPGPWGGQWCRRRIPALPPAPNYAWSFELIAPENGLTFHDAEGRRVEVSFDWLLFRHAAEVLGANGAWFGDEFPIRFDFLDTVEGGNLSVQVHPSPDFIRREFGERFTQDETYYILDAEPGAQVNLGFVDGVQPGVLLAALERSHREAQPLDVARFVQSHPARKGDLFLIPHGTIHGAGVGTLVLEISATPYIFTFKLYDWLRLDLDGRPRPLNFDRGMANLDFTRRGERVAREFISQPRIVANGDGWQREELPTHADHFYEIFRERFRDTVTLTTDSSVQVMSLVDGRHVELETADGTRRTFSFAETFVVPAAAGEFRLRNTGGGDAVVIRARLKRVLPLWMQQRQGAIRP